MKSLRNAGFVACLVGALVMIAGRFMAGVPAWAIWVGLAVIAIGWALFIVSSLRRPGAGGSNGRV
jgi:hypothetical protein